MDSELRRFCFEKDLPNPNELQLQESYHVL